MARRATVEPRWLDSLLCKWGVRHLKEESGSLGYPRKSPMFRDRVAIAACSFEPTGVAPWELDQLDEEINKLDRHHILALVRCYRPWSALHIQAEMGAYQVSDRTWQRWLHDAAALLRAKMERKQA